MHFLSRDGALRLVKQPVQKFIHRTSHGLIPEITSAQRVTFQKLAEPLYTESFPNNEAHGFLDSKTAAEQTGLEEKEITEWMLRHKNHGVSFVAVDQTGQLVVPKEKSEYLVRSGDKGWYCTLCEKHFESAKGQQAHLNGKKHQSLMRDGVAVESADSIEN